MTLCAGGGALKLQTDFFTSGTPLQQLVQDELTCVVLEPIPPPPPEPVINNVQSINFFNVPAGGFALAQNLPVQLHDITYVEKSMTLKISLAQLRIWVGTEWRTVNVSIREGDAWLPAQVRIWSGDEWVN